MDEFVELFGGVLGAPGQSLAEQYRSKYIAIAPSNLVGYYMMAEGSGTTSLDESAQSNNGVYSGATLGEPGIGDNRTSALYPGSSAYDDLYSAGFIADFSGAEGSIFFWAKPYAASVWSDSTARAFHYFRVDVNNWVVMEHNGTGTLVFSYKAGGTNNEGYGTGAGAGWKSYGLTWSAANNRVRMYINGVQNGSDMTGLGTWAGSPASNQCVLAAQINGNQRVWNGWMAHFGIWNTELTAANMSSLHTIP